MRSAPCGPGSASYSGRCPRHRNHAGRPENRRPNTCPTARRLPIDANAPSGWNRNGSVGLPAKVEARLRARTLALPDGELGGRRRRLVVVGVRHGRAVAERPDVLEPVDRRSRRLDRPRSIGRPAWVSSGLAVVPIVQTTWPPALRRRL